VQLRFKDGEHAKKPNGLDWTDTMSAIAKRGKRTFPRCCCRRDRRHSSISAPDFSTCRQHFPTARPTISFLALCLLFDVAWTSRHAAREESATETLLEQSAAQEQSQAEPLFEHFATEAKAVLQSASKCRGRLVSKKLSSAQYRSGRSGLDQGQMPCRHAVVLWGLADHSLGKVLVR